MNLELNKGVNKVYTLEWVQQAMNIYASIPTLFKKVEKFNIYHLLITAIVFIVPLF